MSSPRRWRGLRATCASGPARSCGKSWKSRVVLSFLMPIQFHDPNPQAPDVPHANPSSGSAPLDFGSPTPVGYTPAQIRAAYGIDNVAFGTINGDGAGQTIAIVNAYDDPAFVDSTDPNFDTSDLASSTTRSACPTRRASPSTTRTGQTTNLPGTDPAGAGNLERQLGDGGGPRHRVGARHRPGGEHRPGRGEQRHQQHRYVHRGGHGRQACPGSRWSR